MFGGAKPTFGSTSTGTGFGGFTNTATTSPFAQSAFGKPATAAFGAAPAFGTQQTTPSLFGAAAGQTQQTGLFGGASTSSAFGATATTQPGFGGFTQPQQNTSIFGAAQPAANTSSLFGQANTSAFGAAVKPGALSGFGQTATQPSTSLFGQPATATSTPGFSGFGQTAPTTSNVFGSNATSAFGQASTQAAAGTAGTAIAKYQPTIGTDTLMKAGQPNNVNTKQHCITAMKEYENKSLEELRLEDYLANRKGPQAGSSGTAGFFGTAQPTATGTGLFGATTQQTTGLFGQTAAAPADNKSLFGNTAFGQAASSPFGAANQQQQSSFLNKPFGATAGSAFSATTTDANNPFGTKPAFGQTSAPSLFGQQPAVSTAPAFGQTNTGFSGFGATAGQQQPSLFGQAGTADPNKTGFGLGGPAAGNTGFGAFNGAAATNVQGGGLFGAKPATGFAAAPAFGVTSQANTGFSNFNMNNTAAGGGGLFNSTLGKTANSGFGAFGTQQSTAPLNFNTGSAGTSLFSNTAAKPGGFFGNTLNTGASNTSGGLFASTNNTFGAPNNPLGGIFNNTLGGNATLGGGMAGTAQQQPIHQQILSKVTSPYGDNPIFKDLNRNDEIDAMRATNPMAQKALLESTSNNTSSPFRVSSKPSQSVIKVKPVGSTLTKKALFEGLEEFDSTVESFTLKPNAKRLIIKPKPVNTALLGSGSPGTSNTGSNVGGSDNNSGTLSRNLNSSSTASPAAVRNELCSTESSVEPPQVRGNADSNEAVNNDTVDNGRRESWLHPNNLEKVRQHNINIGTDSGAVLNTTLSELVPRKPLETYRSTPTGRPSMSTVAENPFEDSSNGSRREPVTFSKNANESLQLNRSNCEAEEDLASDEPSVQPEYEEHPTGIRLRRVGYYTIPSLEDLESYLAEDGSCIVSNFTVGREGYGNVYFGKEIDVAGLNLDEIVHFRNKEVIIYPDDQNKPAVGSGLNREAQVTLDQVWPHDKTKHEPIKDPQRLAEMDWEGKLRRVCDKNDTRFIEYRPETGSWVFRVKHFSKYGLNDSDEEDDIPADPKKAKMAGAAVAGAQGKSATTATDKTASKNLPRNSEEAAHTGDHKSLGVSPMDESAEFMLMDKTQFYQNNGNEYSFLDQQRCGVTSPTAVLAKNAGTDSHKLQLMKASFFTDEVNNKSESSDMEMLHDFDCNANSRFNLRNHDVYTSAQSIWKDATSRRDRGSGLSGATSQVEFDLHGSPPPPPSSSGSVISLFPETQSMSVSPAPPANDRRTAGALQRFKLPPLIIKPKVAPVKSLAVQAPLQKSISFALNNQWASDLGLYYSRRFKVGFGLQNTLIVPTTRDAVAHELKNENLLAAAPLIFQVRNETDFSATLLQHVQISSALHYNNFSDSVVGHLKIQLRHSMQEDIEGTECPWIKSDGGSELLVKHLDEAVKLIDFGDLEEYAVSVWSLCLALWGDHEEMEGREPSSHFVIMCRRNLLSDWLENQLTDKDLLKKNVSKHTYIDHLLELIMCHKVTDACELAFMYDDANLALLLSQLSSGPTVRQLMEDQLAAWHKDKADQFIQLERLKIFMFVAGVSLMNSAHGPINTLQGMEWIKALAIHLWYLCSPTCSITDALLAYEKSFKADEFYSLPPTPVYIDDRMKMKEKEMVFDLRYHILQLFSKRSHPLESLLNPVTHTVDPMDYRLSWMLLQTFEALGYRHCSELAESQLHVGFAGQLENQGLWEWSIFVLLHIKDRNQRELAVQNMLYRYVHVSKDVALSVKEKFVINNLGVPEKWIDYAKAVKAGSIGKRHLQAKYLLKAKQWSLAHEIIFQFIAPDAVINDNLDYLHDLLNRFESPELNKSVKVPNWSNQGQIFLDFIDINDKFKSLKTLKTEGDIEARWENLKPQLADLCSRINLLPCPTPKHRLCQSEIAQNLACLVRGVLLVCPVLNPCLIIKIALERLPLPQEFAQQELRALLDTLVGDLSKTDLSNSQELTVK